MRALNVSMGELAQDNAGQFAPLNGCSRGMTAKDLAPFPLSDIRARNANPEVLSPRSNSRHRSFQSSGHEGKAFSGFGHSAKQAVIFFRPTFSIIQAGSHHCRLYGQ
jgi:hypothetical protein